MAKKPITVKLEKELLEDIDNECEGLGCNRTDFVIEAVQEKLEGKIQEQELKTNRIVLNENELDQEQKKEIPEIKEPKIIIKEVPQDNSNKPIIEMVLFNDKYIPKAEVYEI